MPPTYGFRWQLCQYTGGAYAVHQAYKPYLVLNWPGASVHRWAHGALSIQPRDTTDLTISGLGFTPDVIFLLGRRPQLANGTTDSAFGARGGGVTMGCAGWDTYAEDWTAGTYAQGDVVSHEGEHYVVTNIAGTSTEPPGGDWATVHDHVQFSNSARIRHAFEPTYSLWREDACLADVHDGFESLRISLDRFTADGFVLNQDVNLNDQTETVPWIALKGRFAVGLMDAGDTSISGAGPFMPRGAIFMSGKQTAAEKEALKNEHWNYMHGFASDDGTNVVHWGGRVPTSWDWTTERWDDTRAVLLCNAATSSNLFGAHVDAEANVTGWNSGGIDLQWHVFDGVAYRIGYILCGEDAEAGYIETNCERRDGGSQIDIPPSTMFEPTSIRPEVIFMTGTNYTFSGSDTDCLDLPRSPGTFQKGGGGRFGWHATPFLQSGADAWGASTYGNSVAERGRYSNSGGGLESGCIMTAYGANSSPPAYGQHSVNVIPNPVIVGLNTRHQARRQPGNIHRIHLNPDDIYAQLP